LRTLSPHPLVHEVRKDQNRKQKKKKKKKEGKERKRAAKQKQKQKQKDKQTKQHPAPSSQKTQDESPQDSLPNVPIYDDPATSRPIVLLNL
jgi:hypothetical protein